MNNEMYEIMKDKRGFIAALDQSGGSSSKTLKAYGIPETAYSTEEEMFDLIHEMRKRVLNYWNSDIEPELEKGKKIIIVAHGNSLRGLMKYLDNISDEDIINLEIQTGNPICYELDDNLKPIKHYYLK